MLVDAKQAGSASSAAGGRPRGGTADAAAAAADSTLEGLWAKYAARLTGIVVRHMRADYWHMSAVRAVGLLK